MTAAPNPSRRLKRRQLLIGLAGGGVSLLLAACGSSNPTATTASSGGTTTAAAPTKAPTSAPASGGGATATSGGATGGATTGTTRSTTSAAATGAASPAASPAAGSFPSPTVLTTSGNVTLEVWGGVPPENGPADLVAAFQKAYPSIKVNYTRYVNDDTGNTKLDTALQGGTPIDVYFSYDVPRMGQRIKSSLAEDLTPYINADAAVKAWATGTDGIFKYQDKFMSLPTTREPNFVFVNKKLADAAGVTFSDKWTVDDFRAAAKKLTTGSGDKQVYGSYGPPDVARLTLGPDYWYKNGGTESNFDNPVFKQSEELHKNMIDEKSAFPWTEVLAQNLRAYSQNPFLNSQLALWISSSFSLRYVSDKKQYPHDFVTTFAPMPIPTGVSKYYNGGGINNWILMQPKTKNKDAAWAFIRYWLTDGAQYMLKGGKIPAVPGTDTDTIVNGILGPDKDTLYDVAAYRKIVADPNVAYVTDTITKGAAEIQKIVQAQDDRYLIGEISVDQWVQTVKQQADDAIKKAS